MRARRLQSMGRIGLALSTAIGKINPKRHKRRGCQTTAAEGAQATLEPAAKSAAQEYAQALSLLRAGDLKGAKLRLLDICQESCKNPGMDQPSTLLYLDSLAATLVRLGERENARTILLTVLSARLNAAPREDSSPTLSTASVLVTSYLNEDRWSDALPVQESVVALLKAQRSEKDAEMLLAGSLLAVMFVETGSLERARALLQVSATAFVQAFGREHPETLRQFLLLGLVLERQGDSTGARGVIERSYALARAHLGESHETTVRLGTKLASLLLRSKQHAEARALLIDVLPTAERTTGQESSITLTNLNNLAVAIWNQGQQALARSLTEELVRRKIAAQGEEHPDTRQAIQQLALMERLSQAIPDGTDPGATTLEWEGQSEIGEASIVVRLRSFPKRHWKQ